MGCKGQVDPVRARGPNPDEVARAASAIRTEA